MTSDAGRAAWPVRRVLALVAALLIVIVSFVLPAAAEGAFSLRPRANRFNVAAWELRHFPNRWFYGFDRFFHGSPSLAEEDATLKRFFDLTHQIDQMEAAQSDTQTRGGIVDPQQAKDLASKREERASIQREA